MSLYSLRTPFYCGPVGLKILGPSLFLCFCLGFGFWSAPLATKKIKNKNLGACWVPDKLQKVENILRMIRCR